MKRKIYVASSWRNEYYAEVVLRLREGGQEDLVSSFKFQVSSFN